MADELPGLSALSEAQILALLDSTLSDDARDALSDLLAKVDEFDERLSAIEAKLH
jgi:hypothetical protein